MLRHYEVWLHLDVNYYNFKKNVNLFPKTAISGNWIEKAKTFLFYSQPPTNSSVGKWQCARLPCEQLGFMAIRRFRSLRPLENYHVKDLVLLPPFLGGICEICLVEVTISSNYGTERLRQLVRSKLVRTFERLASIIVYGT